MNGFRNWLARYMYGRYGNDELNRFLLIIGAILIVIGLFMPRRIFNWLVVVILIIVYSRAFSRNIEKRRQENMKYLDKKARFTGGRKNRGAAGSAFGKKRRSADDGKRIFICPNCKGSLKVPVGAGRIKIKCPHCGSSFEEIV